MFCAHLNSIQDPQMNQRHWFIWLWILYRVQNDGSKMSEFNTTQQGQQ